MKNLIGTDYAPSYATYINQVENDDCIEALEDNMNDFVDFIESIVPNEKYEYRYQPEKWSIKELCNILLILNVFLLIVPFVLLDLIELLWLLLKKTIM